MIMRKKYTWIIIACVVIFAAAALAELAMGRLAFGPDGKFGWWEGNIWSSAQSQRFADPYSFTHVVHGFLFYALLWLVARKLPVKYRLILAVLLEAAWEVLENSPIVIDRYRAVTISLGYEGDSVLNSLSDILMMALGFWAAWRAKIWLSIAAVVAMELVLLLWVRDNLTLNIIMLIYPFQSILKWQGGG